MAKLMGSTAPQIGLDTMALPEVAECVVLDLMLLESALPPEEHDRDHDGGQVVFSVKELLQDLNRGMQAVTDQVNALPKQSAFDKLEARMVLLEASEARNDVRWARLAGIAAGVGMLGGGAGATLVQWLVHIK